MGLSMRIVRWLVASVLGVCCGSIVYLVVVFCGAEMGVITLIHAVPPEERSLFDSYAPPVIWLVCVAACGGLTLLIWRPRSGIQDESGPVSAPP